jgi:tetratricopeptide (TPR) repeat protein
MLDVAVAKLDAGSLAAQKEAEARLRGTLGQAYTGLSLHHRAEPQFRKALELQRAVYRQQDHPEVARMMNALAHALVPFGAARMKEAEALATDALEMRRRIHGPDHKEVADTLDTLSAVCRVKRDYFTAERRVDEALAMRRRLPPSDASAKTGLASSLTNRAILMWRKGELTQTIKDSREAMEIYRTTLAEDHLLRGALHMRLGSALASAGKRADAIEEFRQSVEVRRKHRVESFDDIVEPFRRMAVLMVEEGQYVDAEAALLDRESRLRSLPECPTNLRSELYGHFVCLYQAWDKPDKVAQWSPKLRDSLQREIADATTAIEGDPKKASSYFERAKLRVRAGQFEQASEDYARAMVLDDKDHWVWYHHGCLLAYLNDEAKYREHCARMVSRFGSSAQEHVLDCTVKTCSLLPGAGGDPAALDKIASGVWSTGSKDERNATWFRLMKGMSTYRAGRYDAAVNWLTDSLTPDLPHRTATAEAYLAMAHHRLGKDDEAKRLLARAEDRVRRLIPKPGVGDLAEGGIENWLVCQTALSEARAVVPK